MQIALGSTAGLTAGFVGWILRGGALFASMLSSVPLLNRFDPLPILKTSESKKAQPDEENTELQGEKKVEELFENQGKSERSD